jgi:Ser/Thr protein kinase RdoA (MazF antagonist)
MKTNGAHRLAREELHEALEQVLSGYFNAPRRIGNLRRRKSAYASSSTIENLHIELKRGPRLDLVLKDLSPAAQLPGARKVRPQFLYQPMRELETYRKILHPGRLGTAICYGAIDHAEVQIYWLFLERVRGPLLWQTGRSETWDQAARWLARLHSEFDIRRWPRKHSRLPELVPYDKTFFSTWMIRAEQFLPHRNGHSGFHTTHALRRSFSRFAARYDRVIDRLLQLPRSLIHGEFFPSNVILRPNGEEPEICPIDWELAAIGPGLIDLAALTLGGWTEEQKRRLVEAYRDALPRHNGWPPAMPELIELVEYCQLHIAVQWLGWAGEWSPPQRHAQNWLHEACRLAEKLGV